MYSPPLSWLTQRDWERGSEAVQASLLDPWPHCLIMGRETPTIAAAKGVHLANQFRTIHYGLGPIGLAVLKLAAAKERVRPVAAIDAAPEVAGRDAGEVAGLDQPLASSSLPTLAPPSLPMPTSSSTAPALTSMPCSHS